MERTMTRMEKIFYRLLLSLVYLAAAAVVLNTFMSEHGFRGDQPENNFALMMSYQAHRPYAYRVLTPLVVNSAASLVSTDLLTDSETFLMQTSPLLKYVRVTDGWDPLLSLKYHIAYFYMFVCLLLFAVTLRYLAIKVLHPPPVFSDLAPVLALLLLPTTFAHAGHIYDFPELLLVTAAFWAITCNRHWLFYLILPLALLNKESAMLLVVYFGAVHYDRLSRRTLGIHLLVNVIVALSIVFYIRSLFASNPGSGFDFHLLSNLAYWFSITPYVGAFDVYAPLIPTPKGGHIVLLALLGFSVWYQWKEKPVALRRALIAMSGALIPLFLIAGYHDETRALYLLFPVIYLMFLQTFQSLYAKLPHSTSA